MSVLNSNFKVNVAEREETEKIFMGILSQCPLTCVKVAVSQLSIRALRMWKTRKLEG